MSLLIGLLIVLGGVLYRYRGADLRVKQFYPKFLANVLLTLPFCWVVYASLTASGVGSIWLYFALSVTFICTLLGLKTGHGGGIDVGTFMGVREKETLEFLVSWLRGKIPERWYDVILLGVTGVAVTLAAGLFTLNPWLILAGALKGLCYMFGYWVVKKAHVEAGELLTGCLFVAVCLI